MDKSSYTFSALCSKYDDFRAPAFTIKVGGKELPGTYIPSLEVEITADGAAGGCQFSAECAYDYQQSKFVGDLSDQLQVGKKLEIQGGYVKKKTIFVGYIDEVATVYSNRGVPSIQVTGLDGLGFLMHCQTPTYGGQNTPKKVVEDMLAKAVTAGYATKKTVGTLPDFGKISLVKEQLDDFRFLQLMAIRCNMTLAAIQGELVFDDLIGSTSSLVTLKPTEGLLSFQCRTSLRGQVGQVEVWGRDINQQFIQGSANKVSVGGSGKTAMDLAPKFKTTVLREYSELAQTKELCKKLAQAKLDAIAMEFVWGEGSCVGLPELIPGRYVTIDGLDNRSKCSFFVQKVVHSFSVDGYLTRFEVKGARI